MNGPFSKQYQDAKTLRLQVEKKSRRSLTDDEWALVAPGWYAPYDDDDVAELVKAVRDTLVQQHKLSREEKGRQYRRAHVEWVVSQAQEMTENFREELFGQKEPPFRDRLIDATEWIEAQGQKSQTKRLNLKVIVPADLDDIGSLRACI